MNQVLKIKVIKEIVNGVTVFTGWVEGKKVRDVAKIVHLTREGEFINGYQRNELPKHIESITEYVQSPNSTILANLVIGFNKTVSFEPLFEGSEFGYLNVPYNPEGASIDLPGSIVDGQQRSGGVKNSWHDSYPLPVSIFISENDTDYIQQFLILNLGKPLTSVQLNALALYDDIYKPASLEVKAFPLSISEELGFKRKDSPLYLLIKSNGNKDGIIAESSITEFVNNVERQILQLLNVRVHQELSTSEKSKFISVISNFWKAVAEVFENDWAKKSRDMKKTYITHGTSITGFSYLCRHMLRVFQEPRLCEELTLSNISRGNDIPSVDFFKSELNLLVDDCYFNNGYWPLGKELSYNGTETNIVRKWNGFQNTSSEKQLFASNFLKLYEIKKGFRKDYAIYRN
ncbi:DGQHR domain-containing protein [Photobacterium damselae subsp. damselae]